MSPLGIGIEEATGARIKNLKQPTSLTDQNCYVLGNGHSYRKCHAKLLGASGAY